MPCWNWYASSEAGSVPWQQMVMSTSHATNLVLLEVWVLRPKDYPGTSKSSCAGKFPLSRLIHAITALVVVENGCYLYLLSGYFNFWPASGDPRGCSGSWGHWIIYVSLAKMPSNARCYFESSTVPGNCCSVEDYPAGQQGGEVALEPVFIQILCKTGHDCARQYLK